jgi:hypothetical protein
MIFRPLRLASLLLTAGFFFFGPAPARAAVTTVFSCASSGDNGNHDGVENGFFVQHLVMSNLHTVQLFYRATQDGTYTISLSAHLNSYVGPLVGTTQSKTLFLSSSSDTAVTWSFNDASFFSGADMFFTHDVSGPGGVQFNLATNQCAGDEESVGTSTNLNNFSVAVAITTNTSVTPPPPTGCVADAQTLCIDNQAGDKRFQIRVPYATSLSGGLSGNGHPILLSSLGVTQGGIFWFFSQSNPEMLIKVINACSFNNKFWVYFAAGTNAGFHVTVTDTKTGHAVTYTNPDLKQALPVADTSALPCP